MDNDPKGREANAKLMQLCDEKNVSYIKSDADIWGDCKDANELLVKDRERLITDYLTNRGISMQTQRKFHCGYMPNFTYKNNQSTPAVIIPTSETSYIWRSTTENIKRKRGTVHILNHTALNSPYCFVVEGEIDCLSLYDCGFSCIGLGSTSNIRKIFKHDTSKTVLIIAMDGDFAGAKATRELEKLCDEHQTPYITAFPDVWCGCKDANELLVKDRQSLISNLQKLVDEASNLDRDK